MGRNGIIALAVIVILAGAQMTSAGGTPAKCSAAKRKCIGKDFATVMGCYAKGALQGSVNANCLTAAGTKFNACWGKAERKGGCAPSASAEHIHDEDVLPVAADLADNDTPTQ